MRSKSTLTELVYQQFNTGWCKKISKVHFYRSYFLMLVLMRNVGIPVLYLRKDKMENLINSLGCFLEGNL
jgi:hypothetical protein